MSGQQHRRQAPPRAVVALARRLVEVRCCLRSIRFLARHALAVQIPQPDQGRDTAGVDCAPVVADRRLCLDMAKFGPGVIVAGLDQRAGIPGSGNRLEDGDPAREIGGDALALDQHVAHLLPGALVAKPRSLPEQAIGLRRILADGAGSGAIEITQGVHGRSIALCHQRLQQAHRLFGVDHDALPVAIGDRQLDRGPVLPRDESYLQERHRAVRIGRHALASQQHRRQAAPRAIVSGAGSLLVVCRGLRRIRLQACHPLPMQIPKPNQSPQVPGVGRAPVVVHRACSIDRRRILAFAQHIAEQDLRFDQPSIGREHQQAKALRLLLLAPPGLEESGCLTEVFGGAGYRGGSRLRGHRGSRARSSVLGHRGRRLLCGSDRERQSRRQDYSRCQ